MARKNLSQKLWQRKVFVNGNQMLLRRFARIASSRPVLESHGAISAECTNPNCPLCPGLSAWGYEGRRVFWEYVNFS